MRSLPLLLTALCLSLTLSAYAQDGKIDVVLSTEALESGELKLEDVSDASLGAFLEGVVARRDWDLACNQGHPGPDGAFLTKWVDAAKVEFTRRGYTIDRDGKPRRPVA